MTYDQFSRSADSVEGREAPEGLSPYLLALWYERRGDWTQAHRIVEVLDSSTASLVHAYLHRREGDESNAGYWYRRAGRRFPTGQTLDDEWRALAVELLGESG